MSDAYNWTAHILRADWKKFKKLMPYGSDGRTKHKRFVDVEVYEMNHGGCDLHAKATAAGLRFYGATSGGHYSDGVFASWGGRLFNVTADNDTPLLSAEDPESWDAYYSYLAICHAVDESGTDPHFVEPLTVAYTGASDDGSSLTALSPMLDAVRVADIATRGCMGPVDRWSLLVKLINLGQAGAASFMAQRLARMEQGG